MLAMAELKVQKFIQGAVKPDMSGSKLIFPGLKNIFLGLYHHVPRLKGVI